MKWRVPVVLLLAFAFCSACALQDEPSVSEADLTAIQAQELAAKLSFLEHTESMVALEGDEAAGALAALDGLLERDPDVPSWIAEAGVEDEPDAIRLKLRDGTHAIMAARGWTRRLGGVHEVSTLTYVAPPNGDAFGYGERIRVGSALEAELYLVGSGVKKILEGSIGIDDASGEPQSGTQSEDVGTAQSALGTNTGVCNACVRSLQVAKWGGFAILALAGTGGATSFCALFGIKAAAVGGAAGGLPGIFTGGAAYAACHLGFYAAGLATSALIPQEEHGRRKFCNNIASFFGAGAVCSVAGPIECNLSKIEAAPTQQGKCTAMGTCVRSLNCMFDAATICPSMDASETMSPMCEKIVNRTCFSTLQLTQTEDIAAACRGIAP